MTIKYALLNPADGQYEFFDTEDEVKSKLALRALEFFISHGHGIAYSKVTFDENNWETWEAINAVPLSADENIVKDIKEQL
jgi:hypothetical protein